MSNGFGQLINLRADLGVRTEAVSDAQEVLVHWINAFEVRQIERRFAQSDVDAAIELFMKGKSE